MSDWFTADCHFYHNNILKFCKDTRQFENVDDMNRTIINNWNSVVDHDDDIYVLGDFGFGTTTKMQNIFNQLKGKKHLITGNHDKNTVEINGWTSMTDYHGAKVIYTKYNDKKIMLVLSHFAYAVWDKSHHGSINLYGHSHGAEPDTLRPNNQQLDVGVDAWNLYPCNVDMIMKKLNTLKQFKNPEKYREN